MLREFPHVARVRSTDPCLSQAVAMAASVQFSTYRQMMGPDPADRKSVLASYTPEKRRRPDRTKITYGAAITGL